MDAITRRGLLGGAGASLLLASCGKESSSAP